VPKFEPIAGEVWSLLPDAEGRYEVSDLGRIRSLVGGCRSGTMRRKVPLIMTPYDNGTGYLVINLKLSTGYLCHGMNELVLRGFVGPRPAPHYQAAHLNGSRRDNRLLNLQWVTPKGNDAHKDLHGTRRLRPSIFVEGVEQFRCTHCDVSLPRARFRPLSPKRQTRCGVSSWCISCENAESRDRKRWAAAPRPTPVPPPPTEYLAPPGPRQTIIPTAALGAVTAPEPAALLIA
jgi:hypothetical protein